MEEGEKLEVLARQMVNFFFIKGFTAHQTTLQENETKIMMASDSRFFLTKSAYIHKTLLSSGK